MPILSSNHLESRNLNQHIYELEVNVHAFRDRNRTHKSLLFHEFTHIYDGDNSICHITEIEAKHAFSWVTEANAAQIGLICLLGFESISDTMDLSLSTIIHDIDKNPSIHEYLHSKHDNILNSINQHDYNSVIEQFQYYLGFVRLIVNSTSNELHKSILKSAKGLSRLMGDTDMIIANAIIFNKLDDSTLFSIHEASDRLISNISKRNQSQSK